jgi:hypothetical protein
LEIIAIVQLLGARAKAIIRLTIEIGARVAAIGNAIVKARTAPLRSTIVSERFIACAINALASVVIAGIIQIAGSLLCATDVIGVGSAGAAAILAADAPADTGRRADATAGGCAGCGISRCIRTARLGVCEIKRNESKPATEGQTRVYTKAFHNSAPMRTTKYRLTPGSKTSAAGGR